MPRRRYLALLGTYLRPQWPRVALLAALLLGSIGLQLAFPQIVRQFIDAAQAGADLAALAGVALLYLGVAVAVARSCACRLSCSIGRRSCCV